VGKERQKALVYNRFAAEDMKAKGIVGATTIDSAALSTYSLSSQVRRMLNCAPGPASDTTDNKVKVPADLNDIKYTAMLFHLYPPTTEYVLQPEENV
jgi:hypothetical protein